jgi:hypothetical protein
MPVFHVARWFDPFGILLYTYVSLSFVHGVCLEKSRSSSFRVLVFRFKDDEKKVAAC